MDNSVKDFIMLFSVLLISSLIVRHKHQWNVLQNSVDRKQIFLIQMFTFFSKIKFNMCVLWLNHYWLIGLLPFDCLVTVSIPTSLTPAGEFQQRICKASVSNSNWPVLWICASMYTTFKSTTLRAASHLMEQSVILRICFVPTILAFRLNLTAC